MKTGIKLYITIGCVTLLILFGIFAVLRSPTGDLITHAILLTKHEVLDDGLMVEFEYHFTCETSGLALVSISQNSEVVMEVKYSLSITNDPLKRNYEVNVIESKFIAGDESLARQYLNMNISHELRFLIMNALGVKSRPVEYYAKFVYSDYICLFSNDPSVFSCFKIKKV